MLVVLVELVGEPASWIGGALFAWRVAAAKQQGVFSLDCQGYFATVAVSCLDMPAATIAGYLTDWLLLSVCFRVLQSFPACDCA